MLKRGAVRLKAGGCITAQAIIKLEGAEAVQYPPSPHRDQDQYPSKLPHGGVVGEHMHRRCIRRLRNVANSFRRKTHPRMHSLFFPPARNQRFAIIILRGGGQIASGGKS